MSVQMSTEAVEYGAVVEKALAAAGGIELVRAIDSGREDRRTWAAQLDDLGVWDLEPLRDDAELEAAATACHAAGRHAAPYPIAERLAARAVDGPGAVAVVSDTAEPRVNHADLTLNWAVTDVAGRLVPITAQAPSGGRLGRFVCPVRPGTWSAGGTRLPALALTLQAWTVLGMLDRATELTTVHVQDREQFGQPLAQFQTVQFALTEQAVAGQGLHELAKYTLWSVGTGRSAALTDALALRVAAQEAAETVFRVGHQLHGASGFCDETPISWLSRYSQPSRRLPWGRSETERQLLTRLAQAPLEGPFALEGARA
jgi:hypothetical protein